VDIGATANPPGFDEQLLGLSQGDDKTFDITYPDDYAIKELAGTTVTYEVTVKALRKRIVPSLDDEFAKDLGDFESLDALRGACARTWSTRRSTKRSARCAASCSSSWRRG
jgi:trigger factor